ncbi:NTP-binding protein [Thauera propionica]|jgi:phospholipid transport system transporter-binding protein|uniref:NTP-binding protein n=1 Tax=Thauera propionica TaxID=2019431 RepID=A0A235F120_9RHOO|nr:STAS domain-containing protein [Thauera propionica]MDD3674430.1 STAS domain-containing protein [Thauera propionica]OYD54998.1 NTP-binding protein [Thauera propionica]
MSDAQAVFAPQGPLTMLSAAALLAEGRRLAAEAPLTVDLGAVTAADSAALALILDWLRAARTSGQRIVLRNLPAGLVSLAALYDIDTLLPLEPKA